MSASSCTDPALSNASPAAGASTVAAGPLAEPDAPGAPCRAAGAAPAPLALLRCAAMEGRAARRLGLPQACALLAGEDQAAPAHARALMRSLPEALGRRPAIRPPGTPGTSFDEDWLLALVAACGRRDAASAAFLLRSRAPRGSRHALGALARGLAEALAHRPVSPPVSPPAVPLDRPLAKPM